MESTVERLQDPSREAIQLIPAFSQFMGEPLLPPSFPQNKQLTVEEFHDKYPVRYDVWDEIKGLRTDFSRETQDKLRRVGKYLHILNSLDRYITNHHKEKEAHTQTLWDEQLSVFEAIKQGLEEGEPEGYIKLPTGTGKTVLFTEFIESLGLTTTRGEGINTLIVLPNTIPITQTEESLQKFAKSIPFGKVYSEQKDTGEKAQPVTIITDDSLRIQLAKGTINPRDYDLLILDEAHKYLTP